MHDIICPVCGERTLARSVGFDLSDRILPLLPPLPAEVPGLRFLFAADEELLFPDGLPEEKPFLESGLEAAFVRQIEDFLLEFGRALCLSAHSSGSP